MVVTEDPPEFVTEWLLPFAQPLIRDDADPWARASTLCPGFYTDMPEVG
jgi:hypothetical protein